MNNSLPALLILVSSCLLPVRADAEDRAFRFLAVGDLPYSAAQVPLIRRKVRRVLERAGMLKLFNDFALGLVGGIAAVVLIEIAQPRVRSAAGVARATEVEVITELLPAPARGGWLPKRQEAA